MTGEEQEEARQVRDIFLKSRAGAIVRCAGIMVDSGRKDLAKEILVTARIDRRRLAEIKAQSR